MGNRGLPQKDVPADSLYFETDDQIRVAGFMSEKGRSEPESAGNPIEEQYFPQSTTTTTTATVTAITTTTTTTAGDEGSGDLKGPFASEPQEYSEEPSELSEVDEQGPDSIESILA